MTNSTINLANVADVTGPVAGLFAGAQQAEKAFVAYFNSQYTICGRKLSLTLLDSQTSETGDQQATTTACGDSFAMVGSMGAFDGGGAQTVTHCGIPDLRAAVTESVRLTSPDVFATQSLNAAYEPDAPPDYYKQAFGTDVIQHAAFVYLDAGAASFNGQQEIKSWTARGFKFVYTSGIPVTEVNYTSFVAAMQAKGVKYVQYVGAYQEAVLLAKAMQQQNFKRDEFVLRPGGLRPRIHPVRWLGRERRTRLDQQRDVRAGQQQPRDAAVREVAEHHVAGQRAELLRPVRLVCGRAVRHRRRSSSAAS